MSYDYTLYAGFLDPDADISVLKDSRGVIMTKSLFVEAQDWAVKKKGKIKPIYSLTEYEREGCPSAYQIYMNSVDEYEAAMKLVGSMRHWRKLCELDWFMNGIHDNAMCEGLLQWREDMRLRDSSRAKRQLVLAASEGDTASARKLLDTSTPKAEKASVGRPKKPKEEPRDNGRTARIQALKAKQAGTQ